LLHRYSNRLECNEQSNTEAEKPQPAVIWLVDDVVANAAVIIVIATEHLLGPVNIRHGCISTLSSLALPAHCPLMHTDKESSFLFICSKKSSLTSGSHSDVMCIKCST
jgi:hypothetical protein